MGKGRIAQFMSDHIWLWARGFDGGGPHAELMRRTSHWLMQEPDLEEETLRASVRGQSVDHPTSLPRPRPSTCHRNVTVRRQKRRHPDAAADGSAKATVEITETGFTRLRTVAAGRWLPRAG